MAAAAALVVAASGRGDLLFLGGLLSVALADRRSSTTTVLAIAAVAVRWGTTSAEAITGAATSLGPGLRVGPPQAAAALGLAGVALILSSLDAPFLPRLAAGVSAGAVAVGPVAAASAGAVVVGVLGVLSGAALAILAPRWFGEPSERVRRAAMLAAVLALMLAAVW